MSNTRRLPEDRQPAARKTAARKTATAAKRRAEAKGDEGNEPKFYEVDFDGQHYVIESEAANDLELYEHLEDEHYMQAIRGFLGPEQWKRFKESQRNEAGRVPMDRFEDFLNACMESINAGNSSSSGG